jgi:hypothetical protein
MARPRTPVECLPTVVVEFLEADERIERCPPDIDYAAAVIDRVLAEEAEDALHAAVQDRWVKANTYGYDGARKSVEARLLAAGWRVRAAPGAHAAVVEIVSRWLGETDNPDPASRERSRRLGGRDTTSSTRPRPCRNGRPASCAPSRSTTLNSSTRSDASSGSRWWVASSQPMRCWLRGPSGDPVAIGRHRSWGRVEPHASERTGLIERVDNFEERPHPSARQAEGDAAWPSTRMMGAGW